MTDELAGTMTASASESTGTISTESTPAASSPADGSTSTEVETKPAAAVTPPKSDATKPDYLANPEVQAAIKREADRLRQQDRARLDKELRRAKLKPAAEDASLALQVVQEEVSAMEAEEAQQQEGWAKVNAIETALKRNREIRPKWNEEYNSWIREDPKGVKDLFDKSATHQDFLEAADAEISERRIAKGAKKLLDEILPDVLKAERESWRSQQLQGVHEIPTGGGAAGGDDAFLSAYAAGKSHDHKRAREILARP